MYSLDCIYVSSGHHPKSEKLIKDATNSLYAHAASRVQIEGKPRVIEAVMPATHMVSGDHYDNCEVLQIISLPITEEQRQAVVEKAFELLGKLYGVDDCIEGGIEDIGNRIQEGLGDAVADFVHEIIDIPETFDCSHDQIELVRAAFPDFAPDIKDSARVTPEHARILVQGFYEKITKGEINNG